MNVDIPGPGSGTREFPERLGRYRLIRRISRGGMAQVYEAKRESLAGVAPRVALKVILPEHALDENFRDLFINEARVGSQLQHPNLVQIQDFDQQGDLYYLVMEYVEGVTLRRILSLAKRNRLLLSQAVVAELGRQICEGLHYAHTARGEDGEARHLVHRDIKPGNIILNPQGVVKVLDFGISKVLDAANGTDGVKGTWGYMSPEQAVGKPVTGAADQFGVAAVLYELAQLERLYGQTEPKKIRELMNRDEGARRAAQLAGRNRDLGPVLMRALQRDASARYPTAIGMARALSKLVGDPVLMREKLVEIQGTYARLDKVRGTKPDPVRSASTFSRSDPQPYKGGIPVSVGNVHRPLGPGEIDPGARPTRKRGTDLRSTLTLAFLGVALCVLALLWMRLVPEGVDPAPQAVQDLPPQTIRARPEPDPGLSEVEAAPDPAPVVTTPEEPAKPERAEKKLRVAVPVPTPAPVPVRTRPKVEAAAPKLDSGRVTISSLPRSQVTIDGTVLRYTPLLSYTLPAGRHMVVLETEDHRRIQFRLDVEAGDDLRRVWDFEQSLWRDP